MCLSICKYIFVSKITVLYLLTIYLHRNTLHTDIQQVGHTNKVVKQPEKSSKERSPVERLFRLAMFIGALVLGVDVLKS